MRVFNQCKKKTFKIQQFFKCFNVQLILEKSLHICCTFQPANECWLKYCFSWELDQHFGISRFFFFLPHFWNQNEAKKRKKLSKTKRTKISTSKQGGQHLFVGQNIQQILRVRCTKVLLLLLLFH